MWLTLCSQWYNQILETLKIFIFPTFRVIWIMNLCGFCFPSVVVLKMSFKWVFLSSAFYLTRIITIITLRVIISQSHTQHSLSQVLTRRRWLRILYISNSSSQTVDLEDEKQIFHTVFVDLVSSDKIISTILIFSVDSLVRIACGQILTKNNT